MIKQGGQKLYTFKFNGEENSKPSPSLTNQDKLNLWYGLVAFYFLGASLRVLRDDFHIFQEIVIAGFITLYSLVFVVLLYFLKTYLQTKKLGKDRKVNLFLTLETISIYAVFVLGNYPVSLLAYIIIVSFIGIYYLIKGWKK